jgi:hypothetical protein
MVIDVPIVNLRTVEDLKKVLFVQQVVTRQAREELLAVASDACLIQNPEDLARGPGNEFTKKAAAFIEDERGLLRKYANNPTMTEFNLIPNLAGGTHWGATFGVALLVGELVLEQMKVLEKDFEPVLRGLLTILLIEMNSPKSGDLAGTLVKAINFTLTRKDGSVVSEEEQAAYGKRAGAHLTRSFLSVCSGYGMVEATSETDWVLTPLGRRILLHLLDIEKFVGLLVDAHTRFQKQRSDLTKTRNTKQRKPRA